MEFESVEVKFTAEVQDLPRLRKILGLAKLEPKLRIVHFYDQILPDGSLQLGSHGLIVRTRLDGDGAESTVKLRVADPKACELVGFNDLKIEGDWTTGGGRSVSVSLSKEDQSAAELTEILTGQRSVDKILSPEQEEFLLNLGPAGLDLKQLSPIGPVLAWKYKDVSGAFPEEKLKLESWFLPTPVSELLELSFRCKAGVAEERLSSLISWLREQGLKNSAGQTQPKTARVLKALAPNYRPTP